jgi:hypothetical protein
VRRALAAFALAALASAASSAERFSFAVFGDTPYFAFEEAAVVRLIDSLADAQVRFVVHVGDFKAAAVPCSDELFAERRRMFDASPVPFVFVPGDNEWVDCHRALAGRHDPLERLAKLRELFYPDDASLGRQKLRLTRQSADARFSAYRENVRWLMGGVVFVALNVPGSNNNLGRNAAMDAEHAARMAANFDWLDAAVRRAAGRDIRGLVVFAHADPAFGGRASRVDGYASFREALRTHTAALAKPLLLVHGDGHRYRIDQPLRDRATGRRLETFTRVEVFGAPEVDWVRIDVDPANPRLFSIGRGTTAPPSP